MGSERRERKRILLVDDEESVRELVAVSLGDDRFEILDAADGEAALAMARSLHPHLVLLDIRMPKIDGFAICRALKQDAQTQDIRVIMLSAATADADRAMARAAGADGYITKPFSPRALVANVSAAVGGL